MDPVKKESTILNRFFYIFKKVFKRPKPNIYFSSPSKLASEDFDKSVWSLQNAFMQIGNSCENASKTMIELSKARKEL